MPYFCNFSLVSLGIRPCSRRCAERARQGEGRWSRPPKPALERSYLTENFSSANRILRPRREKTPARVPEIKEWFYMNVYWNTAICSYRVICPWSSYISVPATSQVPGVVSGASSHDRIVSPAITYSYENETIYTGTSSLFPIVVYVGTFYFISTRCYLGICFVLLKIPSRTGRVCAKKDCTMSVLHAHSQRPIVWILLIILSHEAGIVANDPSLVLPTAVLRWLSVARMREEEGGGYFG